MAQQLLEAYETLFEELWNCMACMLGRFTTHTLMERALFETGKEAPLVNDVILQDRGLDFTNLEGKVDQTDARELRDAMNSLVVNLVSVLAEQVGRQIAEQITKKAVIPGEQKGE